MVSAIESRVLYMLGKHSLTEATHHQPKGGFANLVKTRVTLLSAALRKDYGWLTKVC